jgi:hypothetical protein
MQPDDWHRLGLAEPTTDLVAIKRAYAARLKTTRPDDDAEAYQALRQTYEWAQQWARWQAEQAAERAAEPAPPAEGVAPAPAPPALPEKMGEPPAAEPLPQSPSPEALVEQAHQLWRDQGDAALLAHWPTLRAQLDALPLAALPEVSARLADLVIHTGSLPDDFVLALDRHFGWREDFRTARLIGPQRTAALHAELEERFVRPIVDPAVLAQLEPLRRVAALRQQRRDLLALLHAVLAGGMLQQIYDALPPRDWRALGLSNLDRVAVGSWLGRAMSIRLAIGATLLGGALHAAGEPWAGVVAMLIVGGFLSLMGFLLAMWLTGSLGRWFGVREQPGALAGRLRQWHAHPRRVAVGFGLLATSALGGAWAGGPWAPGWPLLPWLPWFACALAGAMALWPSDLRQGAVVVPTAGIGTAMALGLLPVAAPWLGTPPAVALSLGLAWALLASTAWERGWWGTRSGGGWFARPQVWLLAPAINSLGLCDRWGCRYALAPVPVLLALASVNLIGLRPWDLFIGWTLLVLAFAWGQEGLLRLSNKLAGPAGQ